MDNAEHQVSIRRAYGDADAAALALLCRRAFPDSARWAMPKAGARFWRAATASGAAETWLSECEGQPAGFLLLVIDGKEWSASARLRRPRISDAILSAGSLLSFLGGTRLRKREKVAPVDLPPITETVSVPPEACVWLELIAVNPAIQGRGIGAVLMRHAEDRVRALGRQYLKGLVKRVNGPAHSFYAKTGCRLVAIRGDNSVYIREVKAHGRGD